MSISAKTLIDHALDLPDQERAMVAEQLLLSLHRPDPTVDQVWAKEAEARIDAHEKGDITAVPVQEALGKYKHG